MDLSWKGFADAVCLLFHGDPATFRIAGLSLIVSGVVKFFAAIAGIPLGSVLALRPIPGHAPLTSVINTGMGMPPVGVGLDVSFLLWRSGPFGPLALLYMLYTPIAMIIAQFIVAMPLAVELSRAAVSLLEPYIVEALQVDGAGEWRIIWEVLQAARPQVLVVIAAAFGRAISEVGASLLVGGNILNSTRILTTAITLETSKGISREPSHSVSCCCCLPSSSTSASSEERRIFGARCSPDWDRASILRKFPGECFTSAGWSRHRWFHGFVYLSQPKPPASIRSSTEESMPTEPSKVLETFPNPKPERDYEVEISTPEFTCVCPMSGQPDFAEITIRYVPDQRCVELKSLKLYLWSYRNEGAFHEKVTNTILDDLVTAIAPRRATVVGDFNVRGGLHTVVTASYEWPE